MGIYIVLGIILASVVGLYAYFYLKRISKFAGARTAISSQCRRKKMMLRV